MGVKTELLCLKEALRVIHRKPNRVFSLYKLSLMGLTRTGSEGFFERIKWGLDTGATARAIYYALRYVDDVLDDDLMIKNDPIFYVNDVKEKIEQNRFHEIDYIGGLFEYAVYELERKSGDRSPTDNILMELNAMKFDRERAQKRLALPWGDLEKHYWHTFSPIMNILLIGIESQFRADDVSELVYGQGRIYSRRDLREDWNQGLINIPEEVITQSGLSTSSPVQAVVNNRVVLDFMDSEMIRTNEELSQLQNRLRLNADPLTFKVCNNLIGFNLSLLKEIIN